MDKKGAERRRHERFELKDRVFITFRPRFDRIGWITDISKGGVSLTLSTVQNYSELPEKIHVDIFSSPQGFNLPDLHCKLVYDVRDDNAKGFIETRRCGLAFDEMSGHQAANLDAILNQCAQGGAPETVDSLRQITFGTCRGPAPSSHLSLKPGE